jgi:hypothetical protein
VDVLVYPGLAVGPCCVLALGVCAPLLSTGSVLGCRVLEYLSQCRNTACVVFSRPFALASEISRTGASTRWLGLRVPGYLCTRRTRIPGVWRSHYKHRHGPTDNTYRYITSRQPSELHCAAIETRLCNPPVGRQRILAVQYLRVYYGHYAGVRTGG